MATKKKFSIKPKRSKSVFPLPIETGIVIPSTDKVDKSITAKQMKVRTDNARKKLSKMFGGYTSVQAYGGYTSEKGKLVKERVNVVKAYATRSAYKKNKKNLLSYAKKIKKDYGQESIGIIVENDLFLIS